MPQAQQWEYLEVFANQLLGEWTYRRGRTGKYTRKLGTLAAPVANELGAEGWELVTAQPYTAPGGTQGYSFIRTRPRPVAVDVAAAEAPNVPDGGGGPTRRAASVLG